MLQNALVAIAVGLGLGLYRTMLRKVPGTRCNSCEFGFRVIVNNATKCTHSNSCGFGFRVTADIML